MAEQNKKSTPVSELGEFGLIDHLTKNFKVENSSTIKGVGDDAAVLDFKNKHVVVTTDLLTEGIHFNLMYVPLKHLGYKSVVVNLSDVVAMNAVPKQITVSIAVSSKFSVEALDELYAGIKLACDKYKVDLVGGDTSASMTGLTISITAIGEVAKGEEVYRGGANENDLICISGDLGGAYMGLQLLNRENEVFKIDPNAKPQFDGYNYIIGRQLKPEARLDMLKVFTDLGVRPTSMMDISDGLSSEILHMVKQSGIGAKIYEDRIPMDRGTRKMAEELNINPTVAALNGGEDYELIFTLPVEDHDKIRNHPDITVLGHMTQKGELATMVISGGNEIELIAQGWNSMKDVK